MSVPYNGNELPNFAHAKATNQNVKFILQKYLTTDIEQGAKAYFSLTSDSDRTWVSELRWLNGDDKNDARDSAINLVIFIAPTVERIRGDKSAFRRAWLLNVGTTEY